MCATASAAISKPLGEPRSLTPEEKSVIVSALDKELKDPDAAKYKWFKYNGYHHYCGMINGKNAYGGYIGYTHYLVEVTKDTSGKIKSVSGLQIFGPDSPAPAVMKMVCEISTKADTEDKDPAVAE